MVSESSGLRRVRPRAAAVRGPEDTWLQVNEVENGVTRTVNYKLAEAWEYLIELGVVAGVQSLVSSGADVNCVLEGNLTPLHYAAGLGESDIVKYLLNLRGVDINHAVDRVTEKGKFVGITALILAAQEGHVESVRALFASEAIDVNRKAKYNDQDFSALQVALECEQWEVVKVFANEERVSKDDRAYAKCFASRHYKPEIAAMFEEVVATEVSATGDGLRHRDRVAGNEGGNSIESADHAVASRAAGGWCSRLVKSITLRCCRRAR